MSFQLHNCCWTSQLHRCGNRGYATVTGGYATVTGGRECLVILLLDRGATWSSWRRRERPGKLSVQTDGEEEEEEEEQTLRLWTGPEGSGPKVETNQNRSSTTRFHFVPNGLKNNRGEDGRNRKQEVKLWKQEVKLETGNVQQSSVKRPLTRREKRSDSSCFWVHGFFFYCLLWLWLGQSRFALFSEVGWLNEPVLTKLPD